MKIDWNRKYTTIAVYAFLTVAACIIFWALMSWFPVIIVWVKSFLGVISPFVYGFIIAYLINPAEKRLAVLSEKMLLKFKKYRLEKNANSGDSRIKKLFSKVKNAGNKAADLGAKAFSKIQKKKPGAPVAKAPEKKEQGDLQADLTVSKKTVRAVSITASYIVFLAIFAVFVWILVPQVAGSIADIRNNFRTYSAQAINFAQSFTQMVYEHTGVDLFNTLTGGEQAFDNLESLLNKLMDIFNNYYPTILGALESLMLELKNFFIGLLISVYMLAGRDRFKAQARKVIAAILPDDIAKKTCTVVAEADRCFGGFIVAKVIDSFIIGVICFVCMAVFNFPYPFLISLIVGVTNIIPFFGPFIGAIPSAIIIFLTKPSMTIWFIIIIVIIQQMDGNFIGPKIIGETIGISSFWVLFSLLVMGGFFGITGMIIAVPLFSLLYNESKTIIELLLRKKGKPESTLDYFEPLTDDEGDDEKVTQTVNSGQQ